MKINKETLFKVGKIVIPILGVGVSIATSVLDDKKLDEKVAQKVAELTSNPGNGES